MNALIRYHGVFATIAGRREERVELPDSATLLDALRLAGQCHPPLAEALFLASGEIAPYARVFLTGILSDDLKRPLPEASEITLLPSLSGGGDMPMRPLSVFKAPSDLIRATDRVRAGRVDASELAGDFTLFSIAAGAGLQVAAQGAGLTRHAPTNRFAGAHRAQPSESPGVASEHLAAAELS